MNKSSLKLFLLSFMLFLFTASVAGFVIYKQEQAGEELRAKMVDLKIWNDLTTAEDSLVSETAYEAGSRSRLRALVLSSENDTIAFLGTVENTAKSLGVEVTTMELKEEKSTDPNFADLSVTFLLKGEQEGVERVLKLLESLPYRSYINNLTLNRGIDATTATVMLKVSTIKKK